MTSLSTFSMPKTENGHTSTSSSKPTIIQWWLGSKPDMTKNGTLEPTIWEKTKKENLSATNLTDSNKKSVFLTTLRTFNALWIQCGKQQETVSCLSVSATKMKNTRTKIWESFKIITSWTSRLESSEKPSSLSESTNNYLSIKDIWAQLPCSELSISRKANLWRPQFTTSTTKLNK